MKAVIVNIDFAADILLGLKDIKRIKLFKYIPDLVEDGLSDKGENEEEEGVENEEDDKGHTVRILGTIEWSEEERKQRAIDAYAKEEIEEVDYNLVEAIPSEAFEEEPEIKMPEGIGGPETLNRATRRLIERFIKVFSKKNCEKRQRRSQL